MKALIKLLIIPAVAALAIVGCGDDKSNGGNPFWNQPPGFPFGPNAIGDSFRGTVSLSDKGLYQQYLEESGLCSRDALIIGSWNTCRYIDRAPFVAIQFQDREYREWGLRARVVVDVISDNSWGMNGTVASQGRQTTFYRINNDDEQLEADVYTYTGQLRLVMVGTPAGNQIQVQLKYRGRVFGTAMLTRIPTYNYGYPSQYGNQQYGNQYPYNNQYGNQYPYNNQYPNYPYGR